MHFAIGLIFLIMVNFGASQDNTLTDEEIAAGWSLLFDGTRNGPNGFATQWTNYARNSTAEPTVSSVWQVSNDELFLEGSTGEVRTKKKYGDAVLKFDYRINGNQGFMYRATVCGGASWESAVEVAMDVSYATPDISPGAAYDMYAPAVQNFRSFNSGQWNEMVISTIEDSVQHWQNGEWLLGFTYWSQDFVSHYNQSKWPTYNCYARPYVNNQVQNSGYVEEGYYVLQSNHGGDWYIKNFKVLEDPVTGCMDSMRAGYDPDANWDYGDLTPPEGPLCGELVPGGCKDPGNGNYDPNAQWHDPDSCTTPIIVKAGKGDFYSMGGNLRTLDVKIDKPGQNSVTLYGLLGQVIAEYSTSGPLNHTFTELPQGIYFVSIDNNGIVERRRVNLL